MCLCSWRTLFCWCFCVILQIKCISWPLSVENGRIWSFSHMQKKKKMPLNLYLHNQNFMITFSQMINHWIWLTMSLSTVERSVRCPKTSISFMHSYKVSLNKLWVTVWNFTRYGHCLYHDQSHCLMKQHAIPWSPVILWWNESQPVCACLCACVCR